MTVWVVLLPPLVVLAFAFLLGAWMDWRHGSQEVLLRSDAAQARQTVGYYIHVQDSLAG